MGKSSSTDSDSLTQPDPGEVWAVIPARGGSKGVPRKNLVTIGGRSLVRRAVDACRSATLIDRVIVSTDDSEIGAEAKKSHAEVIRRPAEISGDESSSESAVIHALQELTADGSALPNVVVLVQCSSPFTSGTDIDGTVRLLDNFDCSFTAAKSHVFLWRQHGAKSARGINHDENVRVRRQDLEPEFVETGNAYAMRAAGFMAERHRFFGSTGIFEIDHSHWMEIDTHADLERARSLAAHIEYETTPHEERLASVEAVIFDFDGVLTDNTVIVNEDGTESVVAHRGDGFGISELMEAGVRTLILSKERNSVVAARAAKLNVDVIHRCDDKLQAALSWLAENSIGPERSAFVGNDLNDIEVMAAVGLSIAPSDAHPSALAAANWVLRTPGGRGAAREVCDAVLWARQLAHE